MRYQRILDYLQNHSNLLLVVDNADKDISLDFSMQVLASIDASVLVTSRLPRIEHFRSYSIDFMDKNECIDIFYAYYQYNTDKKQSNVVSDLVNVVWCHTLSVELLAKAANVIEYLDLTKYQDDLKKQGFAYPDLRISTDHTLQEHTMAEHLTRLFALLEISDEQQRILKNFSIMPAEVKSWLGCSSNDLKSLIKLGWLQEAEEGYLMPDVAKTAIVLQHPLVMLEDYKNFINTVLKNQYFTEDDTYLTAEPKLRMADAYIEEFDELETERIAVFIHNIGLYYCTYGSYEKALRIFLSKLGIEHPNTKTVLLNIMRTYKKSGKKKPFEEWLLKQLEDLF